MNLAISNGRLELISLILFLCPVFGALCAKAQVPTPTPQELNEIRVRANAGEARAEHDLAELYKWGQGVQQDYAEAVKWYIKAAEQGDADSELNLGYAFQAGSGIKKNEKEAAKWLEKAAEQGIADAQFSIGSAYLYGRGVKKNEIAAARWYEKAAEQGDGDAMMALGSMRWHGQGLSRDLVIAYMWLTLSEKFNSIDTRLRENPFVVDVPSTRHDLMRVMSESEVSEGKELADEWIAKHPQLTPANPKK
jgi:hypothetical protein